MVITSRGNLYFMVKLMKSQTSYYTKLCFKCLLRDLNIRLDLKQVLEEKKQRKLYYFVLKQHCYNYCESVLALIFSIPRIK